MGREWSGSIDFASPMKVWERIGGERRKTKLEIARWEDGEIDLEGSWESGGQTGQYVRGG